MPAWPQHTHHLPKRGGFVFEEHETELADYRVEALVGKRNRLGAPGPPLDFSILAPGDFKHLFVGVEADDGPARPNAISHHAGKNTRAAGHVEHRLIRSHSRSVCDHTCPLMEQRRDEQPVVHFRRGTRHLFTLVHLSPPFAVFPAPI
jgi:hypothetical protein